MAAREKDWTCGGQVGEIMAFSNTGFGGLGEILGWRYVEKRADLGEMDYRWCGGAAVAHETSMICRISSRQWLG